MVRHVQAAALGAALMALVPGVGQAQGALDASCVGSDLIKTVTQDACQKAVDLFNFMAPQLGVSLTGGNSVLGEYRSLGGLGHASIGLRATGLAGRLPRIDDVGVSTTGAVASDYPIRDQALGLPAVDAAVGLVSGIDLGGIRILGVDVLANLAYVPEVNEDDISIELPDGSVKVGLGARLTIFEESAFLPALSVSFLERDLPITTVTGRVDQDVLAVKKLDVATSAWRAVVGKSFGPLTLAAGTGQDKYDAGATVEVTIDRSGIVVSDAVAVSQSLTRTTFFGDLALNFSIVSLVAEVGQVHGGAVSTFNTFGDKRADDDLSFAAVGLRLRW